MNRLLAIRPISIGPSVARVATASLEAQLFPHSARADALRAGASRRTGKETDHATPVSAPLRAARQGERAVSDQPKITAADLKVALATKYQPPEWCLYYEVSNDTGARSRRYADAVAMSIWPSRGYQIHGHEIKVSRSDFIAEMRDPTKADAVADYCDFWWLVTPPKLVAVEELPETWGLLELTGAGLRVKKQAPKRPAVAPDRGFMAALLRRGQDMQQAHIARAIDQGDEARSRRLTYEVERQTKELRETVARQKAWAEEFEAAFGMRPSRYKGPADLAAKIKLAETIGGEWGALARTRNAALALAEAIEAADPARAKDEAA